MKVLEIWFKYPPEVSFDCFLCFVGCFFFLCYGYDTIKKRTSAMKWNLPCCLVYQNQFWRCRKKWKKHPQIGEALLHAGVAGQEMMEGAKSKSRNSLLIILNSCSQQRSPVPCKSMSSITLFFISLLRASCIYSNKLCYAALYLAICTCDVSVTNQHVRHLITITIKEARSTLVDDDPLLNWKKWNHTLNN